MLYPPTPTDLQEPHPVLAEPTAHRLQTELDQFYRVLNQASAEAQVGQVSRLKNALVDLLVRPCAQGLADLLELMANSLNAGRPGRSFARQSKRLASRGCEGYKPTR